MRRTGKSEKSRQFGVSRDAGRLPKAEVARRKVSPPSTGALSGAPPDRVGISRVCAVLQTPLFRSEQLQELPCM
eukprot:11929092-Alexandrium_andersonii.AAC.1